MIDKKFIDFIAKRLKIERQELIEKDLLLQTILLELTKDAKFKEEFAFKGGNCLIKCYLGYYRFSEDLDFAYINQKEWNNKSESSIRKILLQKINSLLILLEDISNKYQLDFKADKANYHYVEYSGSNKFVTFKIWYDSVILGQKAFVKIQINFVEKICYKLIETKANSIIKGDLAKEIKFVSKEYTFLTESINVKAYSLNELLIEKVRAIITRREVKIIDFIDVYLIQKETRINFESIEKEIIEKITFMLKYEKCLDNIKNKIDELEKEFTLGKEDYIAVFDDDCIPGRRWLENCLRVCNEHNALVGTSGRRFDPLGIWRKRQPDPLNKERRFNLFRLLKKKPTTQESSYFSKVGVRKGLDIASDKEDIEVDWVCNSYFFKRGWLPYIAEERRYMNLQLYINDIQLAVSLRKKGIKAFIPKQISEKSPYSGNIKKDYGKDPFALWKNSPKHFLYKEHYLNKLDDEGFNFYKNKEKAYLNAYKGPRFIIIVPFHTKEFLEKCLVSIENQMYKNWKCILVDDASPGEFSPRLKKILKNPKYHLIVNKKRLYALKSREIATESANANDEDVIVHLDGDDWLANKWALLNIAYAYKDKNVWVTYGNCKKLEDGKLFDLLMYALGNLKIKDKWGDFEKQKEFPEEIVRKRDFRKYLWGALHPRTFKYKLWKTVDKKDFLDKNGDYFKRPTDMGALHPRTFKYKLWKAIDKKDFLDKNGDYFKRTTDMAIMMPILEMAGKRIKFIQNILYIYNRGYPKIHPRKHSAHNYIRNKKKYPLYEEVIRKKNVQKTKK